MTVFDYLCGEVFIILFVSAPCIVMYIFALLLMKIADHHSDPEAHMARPKSCGFAKGVDESVDRTIPWPNASGYHRGNIG
jgi:hypothetical protein